MILFHVHDAGSRPPPRRSLGSAWEAVAMPLSELDGIAARSMRDCVYDVDLTHLATSLRLRALVGWAKPAGLRIFACPRGSRHASIQAGALGATHVLPRPFRDAALTALLPENDREPDRGELPASAVLGTIALDLAFRSLRQDVALDATSLTGAAGDIADDIGRIGIDAWLGPIRQHHAGTYQHCLTVMGLSTAFGQRLGVPGSDIRDLTVAALLHDIGKSRIDGALLDKPARLTAQETALFRLHPVWGDEFLATRSDISPRIRSVVRHHHEYLDGSGYPDGLRGREIDDLTRLVTIADIYGALIEDRAYKPGLPSAAALAILVEMAEAGRLETALVDAFRPVAEAISVMPAAGVARPGRRLGR